MFIDEAIQLEMSLIAEDDFSKKIRIIFKFWLSPIHVHTTLLVVKQLQFLRQFGFVRISAKIILQNSPQRCHRDAQRLSKTIRERHIWAFFNCSLSGSNILVTTDTSLSQWYGIIFYFACVFKFFTHI